MSSTTGPARELVFCHSCENEWFRDQHGLICPECQSDVVEIIEAEHDPRQEMHEEAQLPPQFGGPQQDTFLPPPFGGMLGLMREAGQQPGSQAHVVPGQPTVTREQHISPDGHHIRTTMRATADPGQSVQNIFHSLFTQIGGMTPEQAVNRGPPGHVPASPQTQPDPSSPSGLYDRGAPPEPYTRAPPPPPPETRPQEQHGPTVRTQQYRWGPFNLSMTTSTNTFVNGRPVQAHGMPTSPQAGFADDDMNGILRTTIEPMMGNLRQGTGNTIIFSNARGASVGGAAMHGLPGPLGMLLSHLGIPAAGGHMGDVAFSDQHLDRIISQLMEQNQQSTAPGPAPAEAIQRLPRIKVTKDMVDESTGEADCPVCLCSCPLGEEVAQLPCKHWFHFECVKSWLETHDTCPACRRGIMAQGDDNRVRETGEAPRHWQREAPSPALSRTNTQEESAQANQAPSRGDSSQSPWGHPYGDSNQEPASRWRSRSPTRGSGESHEGAGSGRESLSAGIRNVMRNGIWNWMGRTPNAQNNSQSTRQPEAHPAHAATQSSTQSQEDSWVAGENRSVPGDRDQGGDDTRHGQLDVPEVD